MIDITGEKFGRLLVLHRGTDYVTPKGKKYVCWDCRCSCGNFITVRGSGLKSGKTKSCGCLKLELSLMPKFQNQYDLSGKYGIGYTGNTHKEFMFDIDDYEKIKWYYWNESSNGYVTAWTNKKKISMHRYILDVEDSKIHVDHRYHNTMDNRKENLRPTTCHNNTMNEKIAKNNTSGVTGVSWEENLKNGILIFGIMAKPFILVDLQILRMLLNKGEKLKISILENLVIPIV